MVGCVERCVTNEVWQVLHHELVVVFTDQTHGGSVLSFQTRWISTRRSLGRNLDNMLEVGLSDTMGGTLFGTRASEDQLDADLQVV